MRAMTRVATSRSRPTSPGLLTKTRTCSMNATMEDDWHSECKALDSPTDKGRGRSFRVSPRGQELTKAALFKAEKLKSMQPCSGGPRTVLNRKGIVGPPRAPLQ